METVTLTIDGREVTVEKGKTVLQAAIENGISVPYYCYHPGIGIDGSCRVCIVKIEKMPKLQTSCSTRLHRRHGRSTPQTPEVVRGARRRVRVPADQPPARLPGVRQGRRVPAAGFLLHASGPASSRMEFPRRVFDGEGVKADVDFGPTLMLNRNRCILCTRCVRFMRDVDGDAQINIIDRGYGSEIATFQERGRALAPLGQPDGRLPGRRDHDARLPLQVAAVGQPERRRHDLHALLEGLQHDGVAQGQARVGEGRRASSASRRASTPTSTATGCATSAASTTTGSKATTGCASRSLRRGRGRAGASRPGTSALATAARTAAAGAQAQRRRVPLPASRRTRRTRSCSWSAGWPSSCPARLRVGVAVSWRSPRSRSPRDTKFKVPPVDAPNVNGARDRRACRGAGRRRRRARHLRRSAPPSKPGA